MDQAATILQIIADYKGLDIAEVTPERSFADLGIDSLDAIDIVYEIEERFRIDVPQDALDLQQVKTVGDILQVIDRMAGPGDGQPTE